MVVSIKHAAGARILDSVDPVWRRVRDEAMLAVDREPALGGFIYRVVLDQPTLEAAVAERVADRLDHVAVPASALRQAFLEAYAAEPAMSEAMRVDMLAVLDRDPACGRLLEPLLYFKGFHAIQVHRFAHWLWTTNRRDLAYYLQSRSSEVFQVDIHPEVRIGRGLFFDHATGIVVGQTAVIEDDVSILQGVTLGGTGKETGDRHPKIRKGVLIGAGANVLGNIEVGRCSRVAAGSVVLKPVPPNTTVAGVPAKVIGEAGCSEPSRSMDHVHLGPEI
ncbi:serine O-acetyltransferase [Methylobrevis albus]|uniref:Serine acetyltransferase n=1 Tax=Methylobrevis albus TaxID=2793297 RepID=A0A931I0B4_9HYPH|nr:serine O-acetyltransferase [Methylobrevis albus]MBH0236999.1 serine O-acetyltransferase [Methylobrevis albus]